MAEAIAWVKKYFKAASEDRTFEVLEINGMKERRLISKAIHAENQDPEDITINVLSIRDEKKNNLAGLRNT